MQQTPSPGKVTVLNEGVAQTVGAIINQMNSKVIIAVAGYITMALACFEPCQYELSSVNILKLTESLKIANDFARSALKTRNCCEAFQARINEVSLDLKLAKGHLQSILARDFPTTSLPADLTPMDATECDRFALRKTMQKVYESGMPITAIWTKVRDGLEGEQCDALKDDLLEAITRLSSEIDRAQNAIAACRSDCQPEAGLARGRVA